MNVKRKVVGIPQCCAYICFGVVHRSSGGRINFNSTSTLVPKYLLFFKTNNLFMGFRLVQDAGYSRVAILDLGAIIFEVPEVGHLGPCI